ncbi:phage tail fiber protein [Spirillospora sp. NBC_01491]|uniref:phage tail fiber protein n=1 Tax=Spirillospora sp. NBC_01491 TaxID=2976007 RepID=UPI002E3066E3|nr:hypothetical protein [Spirillospora sp. NBC_01491]
MGALNAAAANELLDHVNLVGSYTPTSPLKCRLMTANGSATAAGTEVTGGSYAPQTIAFAAASGGQAASSGALTFSGVPAVTVAGIEIWDSAGTPVRLWWGALDTPRTTSSGAAMNFADGSIIVSFPTA